MTEVIASVFIDLHLSKATLTSFCDGNGVLIASKVCAYSLQQMLLRVVAEGSSSSLRNALYDCCSSRFDMAFQGIWAETNHNMR